MLSAAKIRDRLVQHEVPHAVGLADNICRSLFQALEEEPSIKLIHVSREGEAFAIASGLHIGGKKPDIIIQNTGFLESGDALRGTSWRMNIPQVILLGYRGYASLSANSPRKDSVAEFTEPTLKAWNLPYRLMEDDDDLETIYWAFEKAGASELPVVAVIAEDIL